MVKKFHFYLQNKLNTFFKTLFFVFIPTFSYGHGLNVRYELPIPLYLYLIASAFRDLTKNKSTNPKSRIYHNIFMSLIVFKGFIYEIKIDMEDNELRCYFKYKLTQNN